VDRRRSCYWVVELDYQKAIASRKLKRVANHRIKKFAVVKRTSKADDCPSPSSTNRDMFAELAFIEES